MKEMEGNHKVRGVRETIMDTEGLFREEANTVQGLKLRGVCSTPLPSSYPSMGYCIYFSFRFVSSEAVYFKTCTITLHALLTKLLQTARRPG